MINKITFFLAVLLLFSYKAEAQLLTEFTAKDGFSAAKGHAEGIADDLDFLAIGTTTGSFDTGNPILGEITLKYELGTGKATVWSYVFRNKANEEFIYIGVVKIAFGGGFMPMELSQEQLGDFSDVIPAGAVTGEWKGSADFAAALKNNERFNSFVSNHTNAATNFVALGQDPEDPTDENPYWIINMNEGKDFLVCLMNAYTGETGCESLLSSVDENLFSENGLSVYPNPVRRKAYIKIPYQIQKPNAYFALCDMQGNEIISLINPSGAAEITFLDAAELSNGTYLVCYFTPEKRYSAKVIINR